MIGEKHCCQHCNALQMESLVLISSVTAYS
jgi:hypothetical protein